MAIVPIPPPWVAPNLALILARVRRMPLPRLALICNVTRAACPPLRVCPKVDGGPDPLDDRPRIDRHFDGFNTSLLARRSLGEALYVEWLLTGITLGTRIELPSSIGCDPCGEPPPGLLVDCRA